MTDTGRRRRGRAVPQVSGLKLAAILGGTLAGLVLVVLAAHWLTLRLGEGIVGVAGWTGPLSATSVFLLALLAYSGPTVVATCAMLLRTVTGSRAGQAVAFVATSVYVVSFLLLITASGGSRFSTIGPEGVAETFEADSSVAAVAAAALQPAVYASWAIAPLVVVVWACLRRTSVRVRATAGVPAVLGIAALGGWIGFQASIG